MVWIAEAPYTGPGHCAKAEDCGDFTMYDELFSKCMPITQEDCLPDEEVWFAWGSRAGQPTGTGFCQDIEDVCPTQGTMYDESTFACRA